MIRDHDDILRAVYSPEREQRALDAILADLRRPLNHTATGEVEAIRPLTDMERAERERRILRSAPDPKDIPSET